MYHHKTWDTTRTLEDRRLIDCYIGYTGNQNSKSLLEIAVVSLVEALCRYRRWKPGRYRNKWFVAYDMRHPDLFVGVYFTQGNYLHAGFVFRSVTAGTRKDNDGVGVTRMIDQGKERRHCNTQWCQWRRSERKCIRHELCKGYISVNMSEEMIRRLAREIISTRSPAEVNPNSISSVEDVKPK